MTLLARAAGSAFLLAASTSLASADEGMWTLDNLPIKQLQAKYGFTPSAEWIDHVMHASARLTLGCSASFVSPNGLVMTNHHCANECLSDLSRGSSNYMQSGYTSKSQSVEPRCPGMELNQLDAISDVTPQMNAATQNKSGADYIRAQHAEQAAIEKSCGGADTTHTRCDVVTLYNGGRYALYRYKRFQDVRLAFAPEQNIAFFGGDPENFNYPRYDLDVTFLRAYENGKPAHTAYFAFDPAGPKAGELVITSGNPGRTDREETAAQLMLFHDVVLPLALDNYEDLDGLLWQWRRESAAHRNEADELQFNVQNTIKVYDGFEKALAGPAILQGKEADQASLLGWINADPGRRTTYGDPYAAIAATLPQQKLLDARYTMLEGAREPFAFPGSEFAFARPLVRAAVERSKPDADRLPQFRDANMPALTATLFSAAPIYPDFDETRFAFSLIRLRQVLGAEDADVQAALGKSSPEDLAHRLIAGTGLRDVKLRRALWNGGEAAVSASNDPMIRFARQVDPSSRAVRTAWETEVEAPQRKNDELIARARFARDGTGIAPDATFTERLSFGTVSGWNQDGHDVPPFTDFAGLYAAATGSAPFDLPQPWIAAQGKLNGKTPYDFISTNDIVGGNSGSPMIDRDGHAVGLVFDGNLPSIAGSFFYDPSNNRAVSVDTAALIAALRTVYADNWLAEELSGKRS